VGGGSQRISPTTLYTAEVWARHRLAPPELRTGAGRALHLGLTPVNALGRRAFGVSLEPFLIARHRGIDALLTAAIDAGEVGQVVEVAAGLSPRGWRLHQRYGSTICYIETDLPEMAARKQAALRRAGGLDEFHRVEPLDATLPSGPGSLAALLAGLDPERGTAIISEGLLNYLRRDALLAMWARFATALAGFRHGRYYSDLHLDNRSSVPIHVFTLALSAFVRGRVELHFSSTAEVEHNLRATGFACARIRPGNECIPDPLPGAELVHLFEARTDA
jgi:O-methyltransferase involved in polyketide biosynthesis